ncbi:hypothetical protein K9M74_04710 [Candidatus Woesearchaeota archaeon]|nr:hypothetical protein [Candidatus Woesearchaeota archaeon]
MCEYHLQETCFHPKRVTKGLVALPCEVHDCEHCTDRPWQTKKIADDFSYYHSILEMINSNEQNLPQTTTTIQEKNSRSRKFPAILLKNPLQGLFK